MEQAAFVTARRHKQGHAVPPRQGGVAKGTEARGDCRDRRIGAPDIKRSFPEVRERFTNNGLPREAK